MNKYRAIVQNNIFLLRSRSTFQQKSDDCLYKFIQFYFTRDGLKKFILKVIFGTYTGHQPEKKVCRVGDGWLVGHDAGEWGGSLWWFSLSGIRRYRISVVNGPVTEFIKIENKMFVITGLRRFPEINLPVCNCFIAILRIESVHKNI
ncbi:hypothetical protein QUF90_27515 [Desulfococcaceae bacterium HSG9]|nr:hypothetical protein [Desulfococcaceae bacterium HSG9]